MQGTIVARTWLVVWYLLFFVPIDASAQWTRRPFVPIAEALSSPTLAEGLDVAPRMFSAPDVLRACQNPRSVARLVTATRSLQLQVGERVPLNTLSVVAVDDGGVALRNVPLVIEAEDASPPVLQLRSDDPDLNQGVLSSLNSGRFRLRIRTLCGAESVETTIRVVVEP